MVSLKETGEEELLEPVGQIFIGPALKSTVQRKAGVDRKSKRNLYLPVFQIFRRNK